MTRDLRHIRRDYETGGLDPATLPDQPLELLETWVDEAIAGGEAEPNAMALATVDEDGTPSVRIVLLRGLDERGLHFFTNYESRKAEQIAQNPRAAATFFWTGLHRQVRVEGKIRRQPADESDDYFASRPRGSQIGAWASPQSRVLESRNELEERIQEVEARFAGSTPPRPAFWGGYVLEVERWEFWLGRQSRLHDRVLYLPTEGGAFTKQRLAP